MLNDAQKDRLMELFAEGSEMPAEAHPEFIDRECDGDLALRRELAELLDVDSTGSDGFLDEPVLSLADTNFDPLLPGGTSQPLPEIDGYVDFEPIGDGGMGSVYRAQQITPVQRTVAIKLIRAGVDTAEVLARFEAERQALARMNHPYIAAVHDAGTDGLGRPYLVMEFADGLPITELCSSERLSLEQRLDLFTKICQAVDHAHRRGVLHRDLKPSNVLVCRVEGELVPKVIDFGIAKATEGSLGEQSIHTLEGSFLGTPEYMSPECLEGGTQYTDTRSDVYSLGVILYELLTDDRPIDSERLRDAGLYQVLSIVRESTPARPSTRLRKRLTTKTAGTPQLLDPQRWARRLQGDLDWIVMKALEKEPERRYGSPHELAEDLENFLADRPVTASPPSSAYRVRKFVRRYRLQVTAAALILLTLIVGLFGTIWFLFDAQEKEALANRRAEEAIEARRDADGVRLATEATMIADENPNLALLLALEASKLTDAFAVHQSIHRALPKHNELALLDGHDWSIRNVHFLRDGRLLMQPLGPTITLWDTDSRTLIRRFVGHTDSIQQMHVDPSETRLLTVSDDCTARIWDLETGRELSRAETREDPLLYGAFSPDGARFVTGSRTGIVRVFDTETAHELLVIRAHEHTLGSLALDRTGTRIATAAPGDPTRVWNTASGALEIELARPENNPPRESMTVMFSPRGDRVVTSHLSWIWVHSIDGAPISVQTDANSARMLDGNRMFFTRHRVAALATDAIAVMSLETGEVEETPTHSGGRIHVLGVDPSNSWAVVSDPRGDLCLMELETARITRRFLSRDDRRLRFVDADFHPDGHQVAISGQRVHLWDLDPEYETFDLPKSDSPTPGRRIPRWSDLAVAETALLLVPGPTVDSPISELWNLEERRLVRAVEHPGIRGIRLSPCGTKFVGFTSHDTQAPMLVVLDLTGRRLREIPIPGGFIERFGLRSDGRVAVTRHRHSNGSAPEQHHEESFLHDLESGENLGSLLAPRAADWTACDSEKFASLYYGRGFTLVHGRAGDLVARVDCPGSNNTAAVGPQGRYLLVQSGNNNAMVWDLATARDGSGATLVAHYKDLKRSDAYHCGFAAQGRLSWVSADSELHVFETLTGKPFSVLRLDRPIAAVGASDEDIYAVTYDGRCQRLPLDPVRVARELAVGELDASELELYRIGTPEQRRARERSYLVAHPTPRHHAKLGKLAREDGDLDSAIAFYEKACGTWQLMPPDREIHLEKAALHCLRIGSPNRTEEQRAADRDSAFEALFTARRAGASVDEIERLDSIGLLRDDVRFATLIRE